jgi:hypothetical protein
MFSFLSIRPNSALPSAAIGLAGDLDARTRHDAAQIGIGLEVDLDLRDRQ